MHQLLSDQVAAVEDTQLDLISSMPQEVLENILGCLPARDAVRTSILFPKWRYVWTSMHGLNFWEGFKTRRKFVEGVNRCLDLHQGPVRKFLIRPPSLNTSHDIIDTWMSSILKPKLEELQVDLLGGSLDYTLPAEVFNCMDLNVLTLSGCTLGDAPPPPTFEGWPKLKVFRLITTCVDMSISSILSRCPELQKLTLSSAKPSIDERVLLDIPKVKDFALVGEVSSVYLKNASSLGNMLLDIFPPHGGNIIPLLSGAPNVERVTIHYFTENFKIGFSRGLISEAFTHMRVLRLSEVHLHDIEGIYILVELLAMCPNIKTLEMKPHRCLALSPRVKVDMWEREYSERGGVGFQFLEEIEITDIMCVAHEVEFAKFMLLHSPKLGRMTLKSSERGGGVIRRMYKKLPKLPRASTRVKVSFYHTDDFPDRHYADEHLIV